MKIEGIRPLMLVLLATLVVRVYLFVYTPVIASDATLYISQAQLMAQGAWRQAVAVEFEPLFPFFIFLFHNVLPDWELAGKFASLTFGVLAVVPFFLISRDMFGPRIAFGAGVLFALHPYLARNSVDALTECAYLFFFLISLWFALRALNDSGVGWHFLSAVAILLTWLTRTEGIWLFPAVLLFYGLRSVGDLRRGSWDGAGPLLRFCLTFVVIALPIVIYGTQVAGTSEISSHKGLGWFTPLLQRIPVAFEEYVDRMNGLGSLGQPLGDLWKDFIYKFVQTFHPVLLFLAMVPLFRKGRRWQYREYFFLTTSIVFVYLCGPFLVWFGDIGPSSHRFFMVPVVVLLPWAAVTMDMAAVRMERSTWMEGRRGYVRGWSGLRHQYGTIVLLAVALVLAAKTVKPQRLDKLPIKEAGTWIASQKLKDPVILAHDGRIGFYAKGRIVHVYDTLEKKTGEEQNQTVLKVIDKAMSRKAGFVFLKGGLSLEAKTKVLASRAVEEIKQWQSPYGNQYTLIRVKASGELGVRR